MRLSRGVYELLLLLITTQNMTMGNWQLVKNVKVLALSADYNYIVQLDFEEVSIIMYHNQVETYFRNSIPRDVDDIAIGSLTDSKTILLYNKNNVSIVFKR